MDCAPILELPRCEVLPLIFSQCKFKTTYIFERAPLAPGQRVFLSSPSRSAAGGLEGMSQELVFFWLAHGSIDPFFQKSFRLRRFSV